MSEQENEGPQYAEPRDPISGRATRQAYQDAAEQPPSLSAAEQGRPTFHEETRRGSSEAASEEG